MDKLLTFKDKIKEFFTTQEYINFKDILEKIQSEQYIPDEEKYISMIIEFLEAIDNINAASALGTLQFVDGLSKFNTTKVMCSEQNIADSKRYKKLLSKYDFLDIVTQIRMSKKEKL